MEVDQSITKMKELSHDESKDVINQTKSLLAIISSSSKEAVNALDGVIKKLDSQELKINKGISILDVKYQSKAMYLANIAYLILKKLNGQKIEKDAAVCRLIELRTVLERIRPLEQKLKYQIDKYIKIALRGETDSNDPTSFKANPGLMDTSDHEGNEEDDMEDKKKIKDDKPKVYKPPKLSSVHYDGDETKNEKQMRAVERARKRALQSSVMQELKEEYLDRPVEYSHMSTVGLKNVQSEREKERQDYEETYFTRLPQVGKSKLKQLTLNRIGDEVTRFENISVLTEGEIGNKIVGGGKKRKKMSVNGKKKGKGKKKRRFK